MPEEQRVIFHCDCNSFYASVELLRYPELRGVPVAVCGSPDDRHGIILAKNEPAKRYGVQTAETVWSALRKCPGLKLLPPHHGQYREMSRAVNAIYARYTDRSNGCLDHSIRQEGLLDCLLLRLLPSKRWLIL